MCGAHIYTCALQGGWAVPGAISAASIAAPLQTSTPASPLGAVATSAPNHIASNALLPLSYWYGHAEMRRNPLLLDRLVRNLGENIRDRYEGDTAEGGCEPRSFTDRTPCSLTYRPGTRPLLGVIRGHPVVLFRELWDGQRSSRYDDQGLCRCVRK